VESKELTERIRRPKQKNGYALQELSMKLEVQIAILERWFKSNRINRVYAFRGDEKLRAYDDKGKK